MELNQWLRSTLPGSPFLTKLNHCFLGAPRQSSRLWGHWWARREGAIRFTPLPSTPWLLNWPQFCQGYSAHTLEGSHWIHSPEESLDPSHVLQRAHPETVLPPHSTTPHTTCIPLASTFLMTLELTSGKDLLAGVKFCSMLSKARPVLLYISFQVDPFLSSTVIVKHNYSRPSCFYKAWDLNPVILELGAEPDTKIFT